MIENEGKYATYKNSSNKKMTEKDKFNPNSLLPKDRFGNKLIDSSGFRECAINPKAEVKTPAIINISIKDSTIGFPLQGSIDCISSAFIDIDNFARAT